MKVVTYSSFKGGCGKSTLSILCANTLAAAGYKTLVVDLDHQRNTTRYYLDDISVSKDRNVSQIFARLPIEDAIIETDSYGVALVPGSFSVLNYRADSHRIVRNALDTIADRYDVVIIDTPPTLDGTVRNAWYAADVIITPAEWDTFNLDGAYFLQERLYEEFPEHSNRWHILFNRFQKHRSDNPDLIRAQIETAFVESFAPHIMGARLQRSSLVYDAIHNGRTITRSKTSAATYEALTGIAGEVMGTPVTIGEGRI